MKRVSVPVVIFRDTFVGAVTFSIEAAALPPFGETATMRVIAGIAVLFAGIDQRPPAPTVAVPILVPGSSESLLFA